MVDASAVITALTIDASDYVDDLLVIAGGNGNDEIALGSGDDTIRYLPGGIGRPIDGGDGFDTIEFVGDHTFTDVNFLQVSSIEKLVLSGGDFTLTLGSNANATGIAEVDATGETHGLDFIATGFTHALTVKGGDFDDNIKAAGTEASTIDGGGGNDLLQGGAGGDFLTGGADADDFIYTSATQSHLGAGDETDAVDTIQDFSLAAEDTIDLSALGLTGSSISFSQYSSFGEFLTTIRAAISINHTENYIGEVNGDTYLISDVDHNETIDSNDLAIKLVGAHGNDLFAVGSITF